MEQTQVKTLDDVFLNEMQTDFGFTPVVSKAVLERAKSIFKSAARVGCRVGNTKPTTRIKNRSARTSPIRELSIRERKH